MKSSARGRLLWMLVALFLIPVFLFPPPVLSQATEELDNLIAQYSQLYKQGRYSEAVPIVGKVLAIREKSLGRDHPDVAASLNNLALLDATTGRYGEAFILKLRARNIDARLIDQVMGFTSEDQKMKFLAMKENNLYGFLSLVSVST